MSQTAGPRRRTIDRLTMSGNGKIRRVLIAMLAMAIVLWAEAGLALVAGDQVMACHAMMSHGHAGAMTASDDADTAAPDSDAMPCCPQDPAKVPAMAASHPPCCSVSNDAERPLAFLVNSERTTPHPLDATAQARSEAAPQPAGHFWELRSVRDPRCVKPILELKTDLRI